MHFTPPQELTGMSSGVSVSFLLCLLPLPLLLPSFLSSPPSPSSFLLPSHETSQRSVMLVFPFPPERK